MNTKPKYSVTKTYHCNIIGLPCVQVHQHLHFFHHPPNCGSCEIALKPEPGDTEEPLHSRGIIVPGKGGFTPITGDK